MRKTKNIRLRKSPIVEERVININRIIREIINESFDKPIETKFEVLMDDSVLIYRFKTNSDNYYDLEFINNIERCDNKLLNGKTLGDYLKCGNTVKIIDLAFVPSELNLDDRHNHELYTKETNRFEHFELMGRLSYLINYYINDDQETNVFVVGKDTKEMKLKIYEKMFDNIFSSDFIKLEGYNSGYNNGCFYFIRKQLK